MAMSRGPAHVGEARRSRWIADSRGGPPLRHRSRVERSVNTKDLRVDLVLPDLGRELMSIFGTSTTSHDVRGSWTDGWRQQQAECLLFQAHPSPRRHHETM